LYILGYNLTVSVGTARAALLCLPFKKVREKAAAEFERERKAGT
jgi:hypothetical protein